MTETNFRLEQGGLIDRSQTLNFCFDGREMQGYPGDTLASALLANGIHLVGRSFKYHRPRGIYTAGPEEPNALVELRSGVRCEPNTRATMAELYDGLEASSQNRWPSLKFDLLSFNSLLSLPAGFYYKTFMWPPSFWEKVYEPFIRRAAGLGRASRAPDPDHYERCTTYCDVLVVGAGPAGLAAALAAGRSGARVILVEQQANFGGSLLSERMSLSGGPGQHWVEQVVAELQELPEVRLWSRTTVFGYYDHNHLGAVQRVNDHVLEPSAYQPRQRLWRVHAKRVILACGALERPMVFGDNDRPGIMLAAAVRSYVNRYGVKLGRRAVVFANHDDAYKTVFDLAAAGIVIEAMVDSRKTISALLEERMKELTIPLLLGHVVRGTLGVRRVEAAEVMPYRGGKVQRIGCDLLCVSGGWDPAVHLHSQTGARPVYDEAKACFVPGESRQAEVSVGAAAGCFVLSQSLKDGAEAGREAAELCGFPAEELSLPITLDEAVGEIQPLWRVPDCRGKAFVDLQNDVTARDVALANREGYASVEHMKRYTTLGMATDQGKLSNVNGLAILSEELNKPIPEVGTTTFRSPYTPVSIGALTGAVRGRAFQPIRYSPLHDWAEQQGAVFVEAGLWLRARYFPRPGEDMEAAVNREVNAVRSSVGLCDVSTLGKIDVQGPDAAAFLNRLYCNGWKSLAVGKARYGLMLREDGMVMDDGTTSRLSENHFFMTTTTANAGAVMAHMEFHHQAVWPELDVQFCSVSDQWAAIAIAGPCSRDVLARVLGDFDLNAFPYMGATELKFLGIPARLFRISFSGELAYELNVPADFGGAVWRILIQAGESDGIVPYGVEALAVMRIEKGHVAGPELNGQTTAADLGLGRMMSGAKDYLGRFMVQRPALSAEHRQVLVGLQPLNPEDQLWAGAHLIPEDVESVAANDQGHVTSVTYSPTLGHWIGLALLQRGRERHGEILRAADPLRGTEVVARVVDPIFYDPKGERLYV